MLLPRSARLPGTQRALSQGRAGPARLAKPTQYTPPSHPSYRRVPPPSPPSYGAAHAADPHKHYPHTFPPPNTVSHFLLTSRRLHFYLSLGILFSLAGVASVSNFFRNNPQLARDVFWDPWRPLASAMSLVRAWKLAARAETERVRDLRRAKLEDMDRRGEYRRAHGLEGEDDDGLLSGFRVKKSSKEIADEKRNEEAVEKAMTGILAAGGKARGEEGEDGWVERELQKVEAQAVGESEEQTEKAQAVGESEEQTEKAVGEEGTEKGAGEKQKKWWSRWR